MPLLEQRKATVRAAEREIDEADEIVRFSMELTSYCIYVTNYWLQIAQMEMEILNIPTASRTRLQTKLRLFKSEFEKIKRDLVCSRYFCYNEFYKLPLTINISVVLLPKPLPATAERSFSAAWILATQIWMHQLSTRDHDYSQEPIDSANLVESYKIVTAWRWRRKMLASTFWALSKASAKPFWDQEIP